MIYSKNPVTTNEVAHHYNELDELYRRVWGEHVHHGIFQDHSDSKEVATARLTHEVAKELGVKPGAKVCDIGCGYGATSRILALEYGADVLGLTVSENQFEYALRQSPAANPQYRLMSWLNNDLESASFDHVFSIESSEHMPNKPLFFSEVQRVLKSGGTFVICAWLANDVFKKWEHDHLLEPICREGRLPSMGTLQEYKNFLLENNFRLETWNDLTHQVKKTWTLSIKNLFQHMLQKPEDLKLLLSKWNSNAEFAKSLFRIRLAYETGAMKYILMKATRI